MTVRVDVMFRSVEAARAGRSGREEDAFYAYLLGEFDYSLTARAMREPLRRNWWSLGAAQAFRAGRVTFEDVDFNVARASASFRVEKTVPPGEYAVMLCDVACANPMADVIPTRPTALTVAPARTTGAFRWVDAGLLAAGRILRASVGLLLGQGTPAHSRLATRA